MFDLVDKDVHLKYERHGHIHDCGVVKFEESWYDSFVQHLVGIDDAAVFFLVVETTDVFAIEKEFKEGSYLADIEPVDG